MGRLSWIILNSIICIFIRWRQRETTHRRGEDRIGVMPPEAGRSRKDSPWEPPEGTCPCWYCDFKFQDLNYKVKASHAGARTRLTPLVLCRFCVMWSHPLPQPYHPQRQAPELRDANPEVEQGPGTQSEVKWWAETLKFSLLTLS